MPRLGHEDLQRGHLVVAEATVTRYSSELTEGSPSKRDRYSKWTASYTLNWVALLDTDTKPPIKLDPAEEEHETYVSF